MTQFLADIGTDRKQTARNWYKSNAAAVGAGEIVFELYSKWHSSMVGIRYAIYVKYLHSSYCCVVAKLLIYVTQ